MQILCNVSAKAGTRRMKGFEEGLFYSILFQASQEQKRVKGAKGHEEGLFCPFSLFIVRVQKRTNSLVCG